MEDKGTAMSNATKKNMKSIEFIALYNPCAQGAEFALKYKTMAEVWNACERPEWLFYILREYAPLSKTQSVSLAVIFAESVYNRSRHEINLSPVQFSAVRKAAKESAFFAIQSSNSERSAKSAAWAAEWAAERAAGESAKSARSTAWSFQCELFRKLIPNPFL